MNRLSFMFILALLAVSAARGEAPDSLQLLVQQGDSCMLRYNTFEALRYYRQAYERAQSQGVTRFSMDNDFSMSKPSTSQLSADSRIAEEYAGG